MAEKIVVIGANSYIARNLIHTLKEKEYDLHLYDRASEHADRTGNYTQINMLNGESVQQLDLNCDLVYLFTGKTGSAEGFENYREFIDINEITLLNLIREYIHQKSTAKIIFPSTRLVYKGRTGRLSEEDEKECKTVYAVNKTACENYLQIYQRVFGIRYCIFRICVPYGTLIPGASSYGTAEFMLRRAQKGENIMLFGNGGVRRTLTYIGDLCRYLILGALSDRCVNDVFNIGGEDYSLAEMASLIANQYGVGVTYTDWPEISYKIESGDTVFNADKLEKRVGKLYSVSFKDWCTHER